MLSSPYPVPPLATYRVFSVAGWAAGAASGLWVLISPPNSYEGLGTLLTIAWGVFLLAGSLLCTIGHAVRRYHLELPGLVLALGGVVIYDYLSWVATFTDSPGSGPRALLLALLATAIITRLRILLHIDRQARKLAEMRRDP